MAKVINVTATDNELSSELDLELDKVPAKLRPRVRREVGEFLLEQTLVSLGEGKTPVSRGEYKRSLSKEYREFKSESGRNSFADLEFEGDLKDSFKFRSTDKGIKIGHFGKEAGKADGHNNFSGKSTLPRRQYLPEKDQSYKRNIQTEIDRIIADAIVEKAPISESKLRGIETKTEFWDVLKATFEGLPRAEIRSAIMRNESFVETLTALGLLKWLR